MKAGIANKEVGSEFLSLYTTRISTTGNFILKNFLSSAWFRSRHSSINYWACDVASLGLLYICSIFVHLIIKNAHSALNLGLISLRPRTHYDGGIWKRSFISTVRPTVHTFFLHFSSKTIPKWPMIVAFLTPSGVVRTENIWCFF